MPSCPGRKEFSDSGGCGGTLGYNGLQQPERVKIRGFQPWLKLERGRGQRIIEAGVSRGPRLATVLPLWSTLTSLSDIPTLQTGRERGKREKEETGRGGEREREIEIEFLLNQLAMGPEFQLCLS